MAMSMPIFGATNAIITPAVAISVFALIFTVVSFWWIQLRRGKLEVNTGYTMSAAITPGKTILYIPLVFHNPAPVSLAVADLRLIISDVYTGSPAGTKESLPAELFWIASHSFVYPESDKHRNYAMPFAVEGRKSIEKVIEFQWHGEALSLEAGPYTAKIEVRVVPRRRRQQEWQHLLTLPLNSQLWKNGRNRVLPRSNDPRYHASFESEAS